MLCRNMAAVLPDLQFHVGLSVSVERYIAATQNMSLAECFLRHTTPFLCDTRAGFNRSLLKTEICATWKKFT